jgi:general stress protein CsbA
MKFILFFLIGLGLALLALIGSTLDYQHWRNFYAVFLPVGMMVSGYLVFKYRHMRLPLYLGFLLGIVITLWQIPK